jgi:heat shock protein 5
MLKDAEMFAEADREAKEKIDAKNSFESYIYSMRNTIEDPEKLKGKLDPDDVETIEDALNDAKDWLESNMDAEKEEFEE